MPAHAANRARRLPFWPLVALVAVVAVIASLLVATSARGVTVALSGVVRNAAGTALAGVKVTALDIDYFTPTSVSTTTSSTGAFAFAALLPDQYTLSFSATSTTFFQFLGGTSDPSDAESVALDPTTDDTNGSVYLPVDLAASGTLSGKVATLTGSALKAYTVRAYQQNDDGTWSVAASTTTGSTGLYTLRGLEPRFFRLEAIDTTSAHPVYAPIFSGNATTIGAATSVGVLAGKTSAYNFSLGKAGSVSGTVAGAYGVSSTEALAGVRVTAYQLAGSSFPYLSATALDSPSTTTAANGTYTLSGLLPGAYTLEFQPPATAAPAPASAVYGRTFLGNFNTATSASYFQIASGTALTSRNITLVAEASVSGTIEDESDSDGIGDVQVIADYVGQNPDAASEHVASTVTANDGTFTLTGLGPGSYDLYVGINENLNPSDPVTTDASWIRQMQSIGPLTSGQHLTSLVIPLTEKPDGGLAATVRPSVSAPSGTAVGDTVSAVTGTWNSTPTAFQYQWLDAGAEIAGATGSTYTLRPGDEGNTVSVRVIASNFGWGYGTSVSTPTAVVSAGTIPDPSPAPTLSGSVAVGDVLTATPGGWDVSGIALTFVWQTSTDGSTWVPVGPASASPTLTITPAIYSAGPYIRVEVVGDRVGYTEKVAYAAAGAALETGPITMIKAPTVAKSGTNYVLVGGTFTPSGTTVSPTGVSWSYESPTGGGGGSDIYPLPISQFPAGSYIYATQERTETGYTQFETPDILVQTGVAPTPTGSTAVTGIPQVGQFIDAPNVNWSGNGTITHQWQYKYGSTWRNIVGATSSGYEALPGDLGRQLRVITTDTNTGFATGTLVSEAPGVVIAGPAPSYNGSSPAGTVGTGDTVTANPHWSTAPTSQSYQWEYSTTGSAPYTKIAGATHQSYTIPQSLLGKSLVVAEDALIPGYRTGTNVQPLGTVTPDQLTLVKAATVKHVGSLYIVTPPTFSPAVPAPTITYAWFYYSENDVDATEVGSLNTNSADLDAVEPNAHWVVDAYVQSGGDGQYSYLYPTAVLAQKGNIVASGPITLPSSQVGAAIIPSTITWLVDSPALSLSYQWEYLSGSHWLEISSASGGRGAEFTPTSGYLGHEIRVITTASMTNYNTLSVTSATTTVGIGDQLQPGTASAAPQISGSVDIGQKLTAVPGTWSQSGATFHYQWAVGTDDSTFTSIPGATASTYVIPNAAYNTDYYQVTVTAAKAGFTGGSTTVKTTNLPGKGTILSIKAPTVKHNGDTYTVVGGTWSPALTGVDYTWVDINPLTETQTLVGTDSPSYSPVLPAEFGHLIEVGVHPQPTATNYTSPALILIAQEGGPIEPTLPITLSQTAVVGGNLSLNMGSWNTDSPTVHIAWYRNGLATGTFTDDSTYTLQAVDFGKTISARITATKLNYVGTTIAVSSTPTMSNVTLAALTAPTITGTVAADDTVTAHPGTWNVTGLTYGYQWYHDDLAIPGATSSTYVVGGAYVGQDLTVGVTASKAYYYPETATSGSVTIAEGAAIADLTANPITISGLVGGNVELGHLLTATVASKWNMPVSLTYQWQFVDPIFPISIFGANGAIFTPEAGDSSSPPAGSLQIGVRLQLVVTATRPGHASVTITSAEYDVVS